MKLIRKVKLLFNFTTYYNEILILFNRAIIIYYYDRKENFGDQLNFFILNKFTTKKILNKNNVLNIFKKKVYCLIGSVINPTIKSNYIVFGSGFISEKIELPKGNPKFISVRGPLTYEKLSCSHTLTRNYGDLALALSHIYIPSKLNNLDYEILIIPHYVDFKRPVVGEIEKMYKNVKIVDVLKMHPNVIIDLIYNSKLVLSSSLHGLIVSDAYGVSNQWIEISNEIAGDRFKFIDYYKSIDAESSLTPIKIGNISDFEKVILKNADQFKFTKNIETKKIYDLFIESLMPL